MGPPAAEVVDGNGGLKKVVLRHASGASAEVYLWGATLTSYRSPSGKENIFVSPGAIFDGKKAIRGGVPVVFPQFGQPDKAMPQHGFARVSDWGLGSLYDSGDAVSASFQLRDSEATRAKWSNAFILDYLVTLRADSLTMRLRVTNVGDAPFDFQALLHTYFSVPDVAGVGVAGLSGLSYMDKVAGGGLKVEEREAVTIPGFTDSVYIGKESGAKEVKIASKDGAALYTTVNTAVMRAGAPLTRDVIKPCDVVVWNPYEANSPGDLPPPAFKGFACVEPGLVGEAHSLLPKTSAELSQTIVPA